MEVRDFGLVTTKSVDVYASRLFFRGTRPNTRRSRLNALRSLYKYLVSRGIVPSNPLAEVKGPPDKALEVIPTFTAAEIERLTFGFRPPPLVRGKREPPQIFARRERVWKLKSLRDTSMLALAYSLGLRASELGSLLLGDYACVPRPMLTLRESKWAREPHIFPLDRRVAAALDAYLFERTRQRDRHPALFAPLATRRQDSRHPDGGIGRNQIADAITRRLAPAGIVPGRRRLTPHALRYSIATHLHAAGLPDAELMSFLRHASIETTLRYVRLGSTRRIRRRAISMLPWNRLGRGFGEAVGQEH